MQVGGRDAQQNADPIFRLPQADFQFRYLGFGLLQVADRLIHVQFRSVIATLQPLLEQNTVSTGKLLERLQLLLRRVLLWWVLS